MRYDHFTMLPERAFMRVGGRMTYEGGGKKQSAPPPPDYAGAAKAQAAASRELTDVQTWANRPTQNTPWGKTAWDAVKGTDPATGKAIVKWTQNETLTPEAQEALNSQMALQGQRSELAEGFMGRVANEYASPFDWGGIPDAGRTPQAQTLNAEGQQTGLQNYALNTQGPWQNTGATDDLGFADERMRQENAAFDRMRPEHQFQDEALRTRLANQGISENSAAYNRAMTQQQGSQADDRFRAMNAAGQEQARMQAGVLGQNQQAFGQDAARRAFGNQALGQQFSQGLQAGQFTNQAQQNLYSQKQAAGAQNFNQQMQQANLENQARQQAIAEENQRRSMSLNEMNALLTGQQVQSPQMPNFSQAQAAQPPNLLGAAQAQGNYDLQAQQNAQNSGTDWGSLIGTGAGMAMKFLPASDRRVKKNITPLGHGWYAYDYIWGGPRQIGVMAQEVIKTNPGAVHINAVGLMSVDYDKL